MSILSPTGYVYLPIPIILHLAGIPVNGQHRYIDAAKNRNSTLSRNVFAAKPNPFFGKKITAEFFQIRRRTNIRLRHGMANIPCFSCYLSYLHANWPQSQKTIRAHYSTSLGTVLFRLLYYYQD